MDRPLDEYAGIDADDEFGAYARLLRCEVAALLRRGHLTDRQEICFRWRLKRIMPSEAAQALGIDESTVRTHLDAVLARMKQRQYVGLKTAIVEEMGYDALAELAQVSNWTWFEQYCRRREAQRVAKLKAQRACDDPH